MDLATNIIRLLKMQFLNETFVFRLSNKICFCSQSELIGNRMVKFWLHPHFIFKWTQAYKDYQRNLKCLYEMTGQVSDNVSVFEQKFQL